MKWFKNKTKNPKQESFTYVSIRNGIGLLIERKSMRQFYDSEWEIKVSKGADDFICNIIRMDDETASNLAEIIQQTPYDEITEEFVYSLDQRAKILYD